MIVRLAFLPMMEWVAVRLGSWRASSSTLLITMVKVLVTSMSHSPHFSLPFFALVDLKNCHCDFCHSLSLFQLAPSRSQPLLLLFDHSLELLDNHTESERTWGAAAPQLSTTPPLSTVLLQVQERGITR